MSADIAISKDHEALALCNNLKDFAKDAPF